jgi:actin-related protein 5
MSELLFECYQVPSVFYGIDSLFSYNLNDNIKETGLILSLGYTTTHIIPFVNGQHITDKIRRINLGGFHMLTYMHRLMQLKYPMHVNNITLSRIEELFHEHCSISYDYMDDLKKWATHDYYEKKIKKIQLPYTQSTAPTQLTAEQKSEKKKEMSRRLAEINARKREERLAEEEDQLQRLEDILELYEDDDEDFEMGLKEFNLSSFEELEKTISATKARIDKIKTKMLAAESGVTEEKQIVIPQPPMGRDVDDWLNELREKKNAILEKKQIRRQRRSDLAKRRTAAAQERMRIISKLAGKEKGTDDFGSRDEDWDVYKAISREQDSDSEVENEKLLEIDEVLRHHDPTEDEEKMKLTPAEANQVIISFNFITFIRVLKHARDQSYA